jgi:cation diffusion facilitator CzcD-associated flavoprotein CzcO
MCTTFNQNVVKAIWSDEEMLWTVITEDTHTKKRTHWKANVVCHATGLFNRGKIPAIPGASKFKGKAWHTAHWPADANLKGKRVAVIGTGPSAGQVIPSIQPIVKSLTIYQRSPPHCLPRNDYAYSRLQKFIFTWVPFAHYLYCLYMGWSASRIGFQAFRPGSGVSEMMNEIGRQHLENQVSDPVLREKLRPSGRFGCKRPLFLDDFYPALCAPNVELITDPPIEITGSGIISKPVVQLTERDMNKVKAERKVAHSNEMIIEGLGLENYKPGDDGTERHTDVDVIIWGTGYVVQDWGTVYEVVGRDGKTLGDHWGQDCYNLYGESLLRSYLTIGVATSNFPNFCILYGPNTSAPWVSLIYMFELQAKYNVQVIAEVKKRNAYGHVFAMMPDPDVEKAYTESLYPELAKLATHPSFGCHSYYNNAKGINTHYYPYHSSDYKKNLTRIKWENYILLERMGKELSIRRCPAS